MYQLSIEGWIYFGLLTLILAFISNYLTQKKDRNVGRIICEMKVERNKLLLTAVLLAAGVGFAASLFIVSFNTDRLMRALLAVAVSLICCYNMTKRRIITDMGLAYKNVFEKTNSTSLIRWSTIKEWKWIEDKTVLLYDIDVNGSVITQRWEVDVRYISQVDKYFKMYAKGTLRVGSK